MLQCNASPQQHAALLPFILCCVLHTYALFLLLLQRTLQEAIALCSCKAMHDPYGVQHFYLARMEEGRRLSKQKIPQPEAMADMMANVLVSCCVCEPCHQTTGV